MLKCHNAPQAGALLRVHGVRQQGGEVRCQRRHDQHLRQWRCVAGSQVCTLEVQQAAEWRAVHCFVDHLHQLPTHLHRGAVMASSGRLWVNRRRQDTPQASAQRLLQRFERRCLGQAVRQPVGRCACAGLKRAEPIDLGLVGAVGQAGDNGAVDGRVG